MTPVCNEMCGQVTFHHDTHLFVIGLGQYALWSNRKQATVSSGRR